MTRFHLRTRPLHRFLASTVQVYPVGLFEEVLDLAVLDPRGRGADGRDRRGEHDAAGRGRRPAGAGVPRLRARLHGGCGRGATPPSHRSARVPCSTVRSRSVDAAPIDARRAARRPGAGEPRARPLPRRQRLGRRRTGRGRRRAPAALRRPAHPGVVHDLVQHGAAAAAARHGVLPADRRVRRPATASPRTPTRTSRSAAGSRTRGARHSPSPSGSTSGTAT